METPTLAAPIPPRPITLAGIAPEAYRHPLDAQAAKTLRAVPGFEHLATKFSRHGLEQHLYTEACASAVRVSPRQCGRIHALLVEACRVLDVSLPSLFISQTPIANAFALGREYPTIMIHTGIVELLDEEELLAVIAHELGHIHCGHSIYRLMALLISVMGKYGDLAMGIGPVFSLAIQSALLEWMRKAEFSADRAAILVTQNPETVFQVLFKLTGGSPKIYAQMDRDEYLKQAEQFDRPDSARSDKLYKTLLEMDRTHPIPVLRAREVLRWGSGDECKRILSGDYLHRERPNLGAQTICPSCKEPSQAAFTFCTRCGSSLGTASNVTTAMGAV